MQNCLFCEIAKGKLPCDQIYAEDDILAFRDIDPQAPTHFLVIPRRHIPSPADLHESDCEILGRVILTATKLAAEQELTAAGYRLVINCGTAGGQTVPHLHIHVLGGRTMTWPPG